MIRKKTGKTTQLLGLLSYQSSQCS